MHENELNEKPLENGNGTALWLSINIFRYRPIKDYTA